MTCLNTPLPISFAQPFNCKAHRRDHLFPSQPGKLRRAWNIGEIDHHEGHKRLSRLFSRLFLFWALGFSGLAALSVTILMVAG